MPKALTGWISTARQTDKSDQSYKDRAEQVMVDVRYWHLADVEKRLLLREKRT